MKIYIIILLIVFYSCGNKKSNNFNVDNGVIESLTTPNQSVNEDEEDEIDYEKIRKDFVSSYDKVVENDTIILFNGYNFLVQFKYYCSFDNGVKIPSEYVWEGSEGEFVTHNFFSEVEIRKNEKVVYSSLIKKEKFNPLLTDLLKNYGVLLFPSFRGFIEDTQEFVFHYSISIPVTDIGTSATLYVDMEGNENIKQY